MRRSPKDFSPAARVGIIAAVRKGAEAGRTVGATARVWGITQATFYRWVREQAREAANGQSHETLPRVSPVGTGRPIESLAEPSAPTSRRRGPLPVATRRNFQDRAIVLWEQHGLSVESIAERLDVSRATVVRWLALQSKAGGFIEVEVVADRPAATASPAPASPVLFAPGGYRVEGLDLPGLVTVLRALS